jgi:hypothetical protein
MVDRDAGDDSLATDPLRVLEFLWTELGQIILLCINTAHEEPNVSLNDHSLPESRILLPLPAFCFDELTHFACTHDPWQQQHAGV